ncbi:MAG: amino acid transporter [Limimaricola sp.]|uniref:LysE/ArgO family amino acid transporter n=1 Tax=Limimaricola sp. TaxID=2211665 RepID=UPI001D6FD10C|nr:LysE family transporter [Limimaricola sp.]MBI1418067.1 amino acid transporter [Limimaricola sp.]
MLSAALSGFATGLSLILVIGAQNAFVLRQGLIGQHVFWLALFCAASDAVLITAGVAGFSAVTAAFPALPRLLTMAGAAFLLVYGGGRMRAAIGPAHALGQAREGGTLAATLATAAALTWLNPHVYLDTLGLIGAVSTHYPAGAMRIAFGTGAVAASTVFFFSLGYGARLVAPVMRSPQAWRILDGAIAVVMLALAARLVLG